MLRNLPLTASMPEGANATAALTQLFMLQLLHRLRPNSKSQRSESFEQSQCWEKSLEKLEQQCNMDVCLMELVLNKHKFDRAAVVTPCLTHLVVEDKLLCVLKRRYLDVAGLEAAKSGNISELTVLLDGGLSINATDSDGATMLHHAAKENRANVVSLLLKSGANPSPIASGWNGQTPLNNAAYRGYLQVIKLLMRYNANPNAQTKSGNTPLHDAAFNGHLSAFKFLVRSGANPSLTNEDGKTPREVAIERGHLKISEWLDSNSSGV